MDLVPVTCREIIAGYAALIVKLAGGEELNSDEIEIVRFLTSMESKPDEKLPKVLSFGTDAAQKGSSQL